jgi:hypothetical protein
MGDVTGLQLNHVNIFPLETCYKFGKNIEVSGTKREMMHEGQSCQLFHSAQKTCAARHKGFNVVNMPSTVQYVANFALKHMPEKLRERVKFCSTIEEAADCIDKKNLPKEYGGEVSLADMISERIYACQIMKLVFNLFLHLLEPWKEQLAAKRDFFLNYNEMRVNQKLYPQPVLKCVVDTLKISLNAADLFEQANNCHDEDLSGLQGSFRKLEID